MKVSPNALPAATERGRTTRTTGTTAATTSVQPIRWWRNAERWKNHEFCSWIRNEAPETSKASVLVSRHQGLEIFPRTSASSTAPASISTSAQAPCASMWIVELVKKVITGHIRTPIRNSTPGQRYARHARWRHTSGPTIASPSRQRPRIRKPVANIQWTCSAGGCNGLLLRRGEVLQEPGRDGGRTRKRLATSGDDAPRVLGGVRGVALVLTQPAGDSAVEERDDDGEHGEDGQRRA